MHVNSDLTVKRFEEADVGELVVIKYITSSALAIVMQRFENGDFALGILRSGSEPDQAPYRTRVSPDDFCLSYGTDWELDLYPDENTYCWSPVHHDTPGVAHISTERTTIKFGPDPHRIGTSDLYFDLKAKRISTDRPHHAAPVSHWKIWGSSARRNEIRAMSVFEFKLP